MLANERSEPVTMNYTSVERTSDREIVIARTFDAPARIVFDAWTRPELVRRWWSAASCEADVRVGGHYRYVLKPENCDEFAFSGEYIEITPHSRLVYTAFFEPKGVGRVPDAEPVIVTVTFDEREGRTHLVSREVYPSKQVLDGALASGMEHGLRATMDQLDELVASLR